MSVPSRGRAAKRKARILARIASADGALKTCSVPNCQRPTARASGQGLAEFYCPYHRQFKARHGSAWAPSYRATELGPYLKAASQWIRGHRMDGTVALTLQALAGLLDGAGPAEPAMNIKGLPASARARIAFARLRDANVKPERLLAIHLGMAALILDDRDSHRVEEFRLCQVAKAAHRLASGTHRRWELPLPDGRTTLFHLHVYPRSAGRVLRLMGAAIAEACVSVPDQAVETVRLLKRDSFGPHPSQLPG